MSWFDWLSPKREPSSPLPWAQALAALPILQGLSVSEQQRLCELGAGLLAHKTLTQLGVALTPLQQAKLALQAVLPILHLGLDWYAGFHEIILIPEPVTRHDMVQDEFGLVSEVESVHAGESWQQGPLVLARSELAGDGGWDGYNLIIHELTHKLDMLGGEADGVPPMRPGMKMSEWRRDFQAAFDEQRVRAERNDAPIDPYAATHPAEFLAVTTELFFTDPRLLHDVYPAVYCQLTRFFEQDPLTRQPFTS
ncbi:zinc-dependent peptidase [Oceanimonas sp. CHS3-5]|uniref:M90 family metallopeptidase n=1 Tax=Oceanimonas sp. CHS3-5 TaxID=3068186 RepID=UPI00273D29DA|nr:zinc-dependent peptidase [Oceanimonas sp. CHS3-5]MDP5293530.1 zinc-dependent peptidase [Oceanimonas sp. CHS3-5]